MPLPVTTTAAIGIGRPVDWSVTRPVRLPCLVPGVWPFAVVKAPTQNRAAVVNEEILITTSLPEGGTGGRLAATRAPAVANMRRPARLGNGMTLTTGSPAGPA